MTKAMSVLFAGLMLVGCATTKPEMPSSEYVTYSKSWVAVHNCYNQGHIDTDTAALGVRYIKGGLNQFTFNPDTFQENVNWTSGKYTPSFADCKQLALQIHQRKQQIVENHKGSDEIIRNNQNWLNSTKMQTTNCNLMGSQVFCTTY